MVAVRTSFPGKMMSPGLAAHFTVYAYDLRGFGKTERPDSPTLGLAVWTEDLLGFLDAMRLDAPILVGSLSYAS